MTARGSGQQLRDRRGSGVIPPAPVSVARQELVDAHEQLEDFIKNWRRYSPEEGAEIAKRWWRARAEFREATIGSES